MGIFRAKPPVSTKGEFNGTRWNDSIQVVNATVQLSETLARKYARDPEAHRLVEACTGIAAICADRNAGFLSRQPLRLYRRGRKSRRGERAVSSPKRDVLLKRYGHKVGDLFDSGEVVEVTDHPVLDFLRCPSPYWAGREISKSRFFFTQVTGNAFELYSKDSKGNIIAWPLYPQFVRIRADMSDLVSMYYYGRNETNVAEYTPDEVIHYRNGLDKNNPLVGSSDLAHVLPYADLIYRVAMHDIAFAMNGNRPDHIINVPDTTTDKQVEALIEKLTSWWRDLRRVSVPFVGRGLNVLPLSAPPKDLRTPEQLAVYEKRVYLAFGWTQSMVDSNDSTYAGSRVAEGQYGNYCIDKLDADAGHLTQFLLPKFGVDNDEYQLVYDSPIAEDEELVERRVYTLSDHAILTPNEAREALGHKPIADPNAGKLWFNGMPLGGAAPASPFGGLFGGGGLTDNRRDAPDEPDPEPDPEPEPTPDAPDDAKGLDLWAAVKGLEAAQWRVACPVCSTKDDDDYAGTDILRQLAERYLNPIRSAALDILTDAQAEALTAWANATDPDLSLFASQATEELARVLQPLVEDAIKAAMLEGDGSLTDDAFSVVPERAVRFLDTYTPQLADDLMGTTGEMARVAVQRGLEEGWSIDKIKNEMEGVPAYRAEAIARTEVNRAAHEGLIEGWKEVGITTGKWVTSPGVRASHAAIGAKAPRPFGEAWVKAGETLAGDTFDRDIFMPPAGVNCRCGLQPVFEDGE